MNYKNVLKKAAMYRQNCHFDKANLHIMTSKKYYWLRKLTKSICEELNVKEVKLNISGLQSNFDSCHFYIFYDKDGEEYSFEATFFKEEKIVMFLYRNRTNNILTIKDIFYNTQKDFKEFKRYVEKVIIPNNCENICK